MSPQRKAGSPGGVEHEAVRTRKAVEQQVKLSVSARAIYAPCWIVDRALPLIGEAQIALRAEHQIVPALEAFVIGTVENHLHCRGIRIEFENAYLVIRNEQATVLVNPQTVRLAIEFGKQRPVALRGNLEDAAVGNIRDEEVAFAIERRPLDEGVYGTRAPLFHPFRVRAHFLELLRHHGEDFGLEDRRCRVHTCLPF